MKKILFLLLFFSACQRAVYDDGSVLGADDFVIDSYALKEEGNNTSGHVLITGEVQMTRSIEIKEKLLPLRHALAAAGGILSSGDRSHIYIFRSEKNTARVYRVRFEHLVGLASESLLVMPGDIIFVSPKPIYNLGKKIKEIIANRE